MAEPKMRPLKQKADVARTLSHVLSHADENAVHAERHAKVVQQAAKGPTLPGNADHTAAHIKATREDLQHLKEVLEQHVPGVAAENKQLDHTSTKIAQTRKGGK